MTNAGRKKWLMNIAKYFAHKIVKILIGITLTEKPQFLLYPKFIMALADAYVHSIIQFA